MAAPTYSNTKEHTMATRRQWHLSVISAIAGAALLAACGGGGSDEKLDVGKVVSFGDSLSDLGTYAVATSIPGTGAPPFFGGRFTTNTHTGYTAASNTNTANTWVEWVATRVSVPITQAMLGFATTRIPCPAAATAALAQSCTAYGQGGARVSNANGWKHAQGALTDPLTAQVAAHLAKFGGFAANDIVFAWTGGNDFLVQMDDLTNGRIAPATALANMQTAGTELATLLKSQVVANGATRVAAMTLPDPGVTPDYAALVAADPATKAFLTQMTAAFNSGLTTGLSGSNVQIIDASAWIADVVAHPSTYGFANVTGTSCDAAKIAAITGGRVTDGSALSCNVSPAALFTAAGLPSLNTLTAGANPATWFFADGFHPSTGGHKAFGSFVITKIKEFGWVPPNL
jgi:outer membrane lipase/esterase